jgi:hypothetical protein
MEPERRIEKLLRAFAKKRREQAGDAVELRPAARQQLQKEISRRSYGKSSAGSFFSNLFFAFRPRLAYAVCFLAIAAVGGWLLLPLFTGPKPSKLASANSRVVKAVPEENSPRLAPAPQPAISPPIANEDRSVFDEKKALSENAAPKPTQPSEANANRKPIISNGETLKPGSVLENGVAQPNSSAGTTVAVAPPAGTSAFKTDGVEVDSFGGAGGLNKDTAREKIAPVAPAVTASPPVTAPTLAATEQETQKKLALAKTPPPPTSGDFSFAKAEAAAVAPVASQHFYRLDVPMNRQRVEGMLSAPQPLLASFRVEQNGDAMRIVDADGSVYTGALQVAQEESTSRALFSDALKSQPPAASAAKTPAQSQAVQNYFFRVAGTNRNLNQNIVFSGNLIPLTNVPFLRTNAGAFGGAAGVRRVTPASSAPISLLLNSRISGKAVIGNQKEIEVNATPAP